MTIITVPHPTLRQQAQEVSLVTPELSVFIEQLSKTLKNKKNPQGVGLAAPQVDTLWQIFSTYLPLDPTDDKSPTILKAFINPRIIDHSEKITFGPIPKKPVLEGCLSIPGLYGPIPRWETVSFEFEEIQGNELKTSMGTYHDFEARVMQHELDHLSGTLFTDYTLKYDLPIYQENPKDGELEELKHRDILNLF